LARVKPHTGWAALVALAGPPASAEVIAKRRLVMATTFETGAVYHAGQGLPLEKAEALIRSSAERFEGLARDALQALVAELRAAGGVRGGLGRGEAPAAPGKRAEIAPVRPPRRGGALPGGAGEGQPEPGAAGAGQGPRGHGLGRPVALAGHAGGAARGHGKASGRPWTRDQKEAALAAWIALAS